MKAPEPLPVLKFAICSSPPHLRPALQLLLEALQQAHELRLGRWELSVEAQALRDCGLTNNDLRWLIGRSWVEHAVEKTDPADTSRSFQRILNLSIPEQACFVLTPAGLTAARDLGVVAIEHGGTKAAPTQTALPLWDGELRELRVGGEVVKRFRQHAGNQEAILAAFEEEGWPRRIDNPLPPNQADGHERLHGAITRLNRHQVRRLLQFRSDGRGEGVRWESVTGASPERHRSDS